jgi:phospholipase D1/2
MTDEVTVPQNRLDAAAAPLAAAGKLGHWPLLTWLAVLLLKICVLWFLQWKYDIAQHLSPEKIGVTVALLQGWIAAMGAWGFLVIVGSFSFSMVMTFPFFPVVFTCVLAYGWMLGVPLAVVIAGLSLTMMYQLGQFLGRPALARIFGDRLLKANAALQGREFISVLTARLIFYMTPVVSWGLCVSGISYRNLMLGSLLGALPGIILQAWLVTILLDLAENAGVSESAKYPELAFHLLAGVGLLLLLRVWIPRMIKRGLRKP